MTMTTPRASRGFTLVEMAVTVLILSLLIGFGAAALRRSGTRVGLRGAVEGVSGQLRLARERAIATGRAQTMHFTMNYPSGTGWDYHLHNSANPEAGWALPVGCIWYATPGTLVFNTNGTVTNNGVNWVIIQDGIGERDTCYVTSSGLVLQK
jgi:prepilin-type N-terminal cleavage/methylation domain-containing protein